MECAVEFKNYLEEALQLRLEAAELPDLASCPAFTKLQRFITANAVERSEYRLLQKRLRLHQLSKQAAQIQRNASNQELEERRDACLAQIREGAAAGPPEKRVEPVYNTYHDQQLVSTRVFYSNLAAAVAGWAAAAASERAALDERVAALRQSIRDGALPVKLQRLTIQPGVRKNGVEEPDFTLCYKEVSRMIVANRRLEEELARNYCLHFHYTGPDDNNFYELFGLGGLLDQPQPGGRVGAVTRAAMALEYVNQQARAQMGQLAARRNGPGLDRLRAEVAAKENLYNNQLLLLRQAYDGYVGLRHRLRGLTELLGGNQTVLMIANNKTQADVVRREVVSQMGTYLVNRRADFKLLTGRDCQYGFAGFQEYAVLCAEYFSQRTLWRGLLGTASVEQGIRGINSRLRHMIADIEESLDARAEAAARLIERLEVGGGHSESDVIPRPSITGEPEDAREPTGMAPLDRLAMLRARYERLRATD